MSEDSGEKTKQATPKKSATHARKARSARART